MGINNQESLFSINSTTYTKRVELITFTDDQSTLLRRDRDLNSLHPWSSWVRQFNMWFISLIHTLQKTEESIYNYHM
jgi:hypothetical protein